MKFAIKKTIDILIRYLKIQAEAHGHKQVRKIYFFRKLQKRPLNAPYLK